MTLKTLLKASSAFVLLSAIAANAQQTHPETGETLAEEQTFTYRVLDEHSSVDPQVVEDVTGSEIVRDLFEGLMNQNAAGELVPGVATGYEVSDDGLTYTFTLRDDARWSNGDPVLASDFVYAWKRAVDPELASEYAWFMELMSIENAAAIIAGEMDKEELGVAAPDENTFVVTLSQPLPYFAQMTTHATTFPVHPATVEEFGSEWTRPENIVSNGAYILQEHVPQERLVRVRNENYWNNENTIIDEVTSLVINDVNQSLTRYLAGELDRTETPPGQFPRLAEEYPDQAISIPRLCSYYYNFNLSEGGPEALQDVRVRQALNLAVNRDVIVNNVLASGQTAAYNFTPVRTADFELPDIPAASMTQEERNAMAVELITEAGYGIGGEPLTIELLYNTDEAHRNVAIAMSQMWEQTLGIETTLANQEWQTFLQTRGNQNFEMARGAWCGDYNEASTFLDLVTTESGYNDAKYSNAEVDQLMAEAKTAEDPQPNYTRVEQVIAEEVPIIPIYHYADGYMFNPALKGWPVDNVEQNWYSRQLYKVADE
jgi:oligopeptide transport system substrate-binding protein